ncbi:NO signaling/Golgi transport ligand-binding domain-containing protein [Halteromyces radiatus]|uniref:NO signaling/Golgi transport ligand-binding domain-containing protein n=1 Tax=Halteromyces radiatus TaxID=101107 RepID=UPI0022202F67|nr:NO signaling/Golgi transport ligand-binding domain-containing protein [Halteromyces radiatus]KAI8096872.1 NO signaling/Golgi transport ligand-binding domain-containing protein [Halteromyces radiatus]
MSDSVNTPRLSTNSSIYTEQRVARGKTILDRNLNKTRGAEVSLSAQSFLFSEMLQYTQKRVNGIQDLERKLNEFGYRVGTRMLELLTWREKVAKRETRVLGVLYFIHNVVWRSLFGKQADSLEKSTENEDEYMISDNDPILTRYISVPKELSQLNCNAFVAGIVEACLDGYQFPARVTAHTVPIDGFPQRTTILIKLDKEVLQREELLK